MNAFPKVRPSSGSNDVHVPNPEQCGSLHYKISIFSWSLKKKNRRSVLGNNTRTYIYKILILIVHVGARVIYAERSAERRHRRGNISVRIYHIKVRTTRIVYIIHACAYLVAV